MGVDVIGFRKDRKCQIFFYSENKKEFNTFSVRFLRGPLEVNDHKFTGDQHWLHAFSRLINTLGPFVEEAELYLTRAGVLLGECNQEEVFKGAEHGRLTL